MDLRWPFLDLRWLLPDPLVGAFVGFIVGFLAPGSLDFWGMALPRFLPLAGGLVGAGAGCVVGIFRQGPPGRSQTVAWWCATMTFVIGIVSFLCGFVGPILLDPDSPQGPLLGFFVTGPLGALAGTVTGVVVGLLVPR